MVISLCRLRPRPAWVIVLLLAAGFSRAQEKEPLPHKVDLGPEFQKLGLVAREQGERDTCSTFAITALADFEYSKHTSGAHEVLSEEYLIWASNDASGLKGDQAMFFKAVHGLNAHGVCSAELMPYAAKSDAGRKPSDEAGRDAKRLAQRWKVQWIKRWDATSALTGEELRAIKKALANGHPVACGLRWPKRLQGHEVLEVPPPDKVFDGHSIVLTGYEDDPKKDGAGILLFRNSAGPKWGNDGYGTMSYAYARTYANDALFLELGAPGSETPTERFHAESMTILGREKCETTSQKMDSWGELMWTDGKQLFCKAQQGGFVEFGFEVRKAGEYRLRALASAAPDFGKIRARLDGSSTSGEFDLYCGKVSPSGSLELGTHDLSKGKHTIRFTVVGKNAASANYFFGIDAVDIIAVK